MHPNVHPFFFFKRAEHFVSSSFLISAAFNNAYFFLSAASF